MVCVIGGLSGYGEWQPSYLSKKNVEQHVIRNNQERMNWATVFGKQVFSKSIRRWVD